MFFVAAAAGFLTPFAEAREALREGNPLRDLGTLWSHINSGFRTLLSTRLDLYADGEDAAYAKTSAVILSPGGLEALLDHAEVREGEPRLEVVAARARHMREAASIGLAALMRRWRDHPRVGTRWVDQLRVDTGDTYLDVMLDGEPLQLKAPVEFTLKSKAVRFLAA